MSALQKYKAEAKRLAEENKTLREENAKFKAGRMIYIHPMPMKDSIMEDIFQRSTALAQRLIPLASDFGGYPLIASLIEESLHEAFEAGRELE